MRNFANVYASLTYDANTAKPRRDAAWKLPPGRPGSTTILNDLQAPEVVAMFARHQTAEDYRTVRKSGLEYKRWAMKKPRVSDNEWLDTDAACRAIAEYVGCATFDEGAEDENKRAKFANGLRSVNRRLRTI